MVDLVQRVAKPAILSAYLYVPLEVVGDVWRLKQRLTFIPKRTSPMHPPGDPVEMFDEHSHEGYIGVPREWGLDAYPDIEIDDRRSFGSPISAPRLPSPDHPQVLDPVAQRAFMDGMFTMLQDVQSGGVCAATGSGKTVVTLHTAVRIGRTTLIVVHLQRLMHQWVDEIHDKLGVPRNRIGIVQGDKCQYEGKDFVVAMVQSLTSHRYPDEFYRWPGLVGFDEEHKMGTAAFARAISLFPSFYKMAMSATWKRRDGGHAVFEHHIGPVRVVSDAEALPMTVHVIEYNAGKRVLDYDHAALALSLMEDNVRNEKWARLLFQAYKKGRILLAVSDRTEQLQMIRRRLIALGVPESETGLFVDSRYEWVDNPEKPGKKKKIKRKMDPQVLAYIKANARIIFTTYGMMTEGIDIPRVDAGADLSPRAQATQLIGRIRRPLPGKRRPIWVTFKDTCSVRALRYFKSRVKDYLTTNVEVVYGNENSSSSDGASQERVLGRGPERTTTQAVRGRPAVSP